VVVRYSDNRKGRWIELALVPALETGQAVAEAAGQAYASWPEDDADIAPGQWDAPPVRGRITATAATARARSREAGATEVWRASRYLHGQRHASAMLMFARDMYLVRIQAHQEDAQAQALPPLVGELEQFAAQVAAQLRVLNTGACWLPARIEPVERITPELEQLALAAHLEQGRTVAVATGQQLWVTPLAAARSARLGQALTAQVYPGCVAPEAIEPEVGPHLRELRIEYRPAEAPGGSGRRWRRGSRAASVRNTA
jgi:phosphoserine phosphatase